MFSYRNAKGFSAVEVIVVIVVIVIGIALLLPMLGAGQRASKHLMNSTQLRGIQQAMVTFAQSNKRGGNDGYFPGLDASGEAVPDGEKTGYSGDGTQPAARMWMMLAGNHFTPQYIINPADPRAVEYEFSPTGKADPNSPVTAQNYSYAMLGIAEALNQDQQGNFAPGDDTRALEWKQTLNTSNPILSDRAIGTGPGDISSVWTEPGSAPGKSDWRGTIVRNDNSTSFKDSPVIEQTHFGNADVNAFDDIFEDAPGVTDTFLVHPDATTAYGPE